MGANVNLTVGQWFTFSSSPSACDEEKVPKDLSGPFKVVGCKNPNSPRALYTLVRYPEYLDYCPRIYGVGNRVGAWTLSDAYTVSVIRQDESTIVKDLARGVKSVQRCARDWLNLEPGQWIDFSTEDEQERLPQELEGSFKVLSREDREQDKYGREDKCRCFLLSLPKKLIDFCPRRGVVDVHGVNPKDLPWDYRIKVIDGIKIDRELEKTRVKACFDQYTDLLLDQRQLEERAHSSAQ